MDADTTELPGGGTYVPRDIRILLSVGLFLAAVLCVCWFSVKWAEERLLKSEAKIAAQSWTVFLSKDLKHLQGILEGAPVTADDQEIIDTASEAGRIFRYKFFGSMGRIVHASRPGDIGQANRKWYFRDVVRKGQSFAIIEKDKNFGGWRKAVSEAYVPIMRDGVFIGAIEVYVDVTARAVRFALYSRKVLLFLSLILTVSCIATGAIVIQFSRKQKNGTS